MTSQRRFLGLPLGRLVGLVLLLAATPSYARKMEGRTGFGVTLHPFNSTPSLSMRHHMTDYQSAVVMFGFNTADVGKVIVLGGKFYQAAHLEENLNFYVGIGGFLISDKGGTATSSSGIEIDGFFGGEFFITGLPNLGFQFESGVAMRTVRSVSFASTGFVGAGIHYYF